MLLLVALVVAGLLGLVVAVLFVPMELTVRVRRRRALRFRGRVRWLFGLIEVPLGASRRGPDSRAPDEGPETGVDRVSAPEETDRRASARSRGQRLRRFRAALASPGFVGRALRLVPDVLRKVRIRRLHLWARLGRDDPADTGVLWGVLGPVTGILADTGADVVLVPDFQRAVFLLDASGRLRVVPARVLASLLGFLLAPATLRAGWAAIRAGRR